MTMNGLDREQIHNNLREKVVTEWTDALYKFHLSNEYPEAENVREYYHPEILGECIGEDVTIGNMAKVGPDERKDFLRCYIHALAKKGIPHVITYKGSLESITQVERDEDYIDHLVGVNPETITKTAERNTEPKIRRVTFAEFYLEDIKENPELSSQINPEDITKTAKRYIEHQISRLTLAELYLEGIEENPEPSSQINPKDITETAGQIRRVTLAELYPVADIIEMIYDSATEKEARIFDKWQDIIDGNSSDAENASKEIGDILEY